MIGAVEDESGSLARESGEEGADSLKLGDGLVYKALDFLQLLSILSFPTQTSFGIHTSSLSFTTTTKIHTRPSVDNRQPHSYNMPSQCNCTSCSCTSCDSCSCCVSQASVFHKVEMEADIMLAPVPLSSTSPQQCLIRKMELLITRPIARTRFR